MSSTPNCPRKILYCNCSFARIVPDSVKKEVLDGLVSSGVRFEAVADLCDLSANKDQRLRELTSNKGELRIAACFPRAVKWLFAAAAVPLPDTVQVHNMRTDDASSIVEALVGESASVASARGERGDDRVSQREVPSETTK